MTSLQVILAFIEALLVVSLLMLVFRRYRLHGSLFLIWIAANCWLTFYLVILGHALSEMTKTDEILSVVILKWIHGTVATLEIVCYVPLLLVGIPLLLARLRKTECPRRLQRLERHRKWAPRVVCLHLAAVLTYPKGPIEWILKQI